MEELVNRIAIIAWSSISAVDLKLGEVAGGDPLVRRLTLIDCPGHFAFIRTVLAASSVFDAAICVVNAGEHYRWLAIVLQP
jgi:translation initiation factor 2 gamma subunit (eIF-2gamma)